MCRASDPSSLVGMRTGEATLVRQVQARTRADLARIGWTDRRIAAEVRAGRVRRAARGVYVLVDPAGGAATGTAQQREAEYLDRIRAILQRAGDVLVSHLSALILWGLPVVYADFSYLHITADRAAGGQRRSGVHRHGAAGVVPEVRRAGVRVTTVARTLVDVARTADPRTALAACDAALRTTLVTREELACELEAARSRRGVAAARRVIDLARGQCESAGESVCRWAFHAAGLAQPDCQVTVRDAGGAFLGRCDFGYRALGLLIEFDGDLKYGGLLGGRDARAALIEEKARENALRRAGFVVLRLVWSDLADVDRLRRLVEAAMDQARRCHGAGLITGTMDPA